MTIKEKLKEFVSEKKERYVFIYDNINNLLWKTTARAALSEADYYYDFRQTLLNQEVGRFEVTISQANKNELTIWLDTIVIFRNLETSDYDIANPYAGRCAH